MKILFIGNSHTFMNDMPALVRDMVREVTGEECECVMLAYGGRSLKWHMSEEYFAVRFNILHGGYDYCVMQEVAHPMTSEDDTYESVRKITDLCRTAGTVPVIFETWAEKAMPEHQAEMNRRYHYIAGETGARLAPVGEIWKKVKDDADIELYWRDGEHASPDGDYLTALVFTKVITGSMPARDFRRAYDFSLHEWGMKLKENVPDEHIELSQETVDVFHRAVEEIL